MRILDCSPVHNELLVAEVKAHENALWMTETHLTEGDRTFKNRAKEDWVLPDRPWPRTQVHRFRASAVFRGGLWAVPLGPWYWRHSDCHWYNEAMQRNAALAQLDFDDDDIVILSDVDEILDSRHQDQLVACTQRHGMITVKLRVTHYRFDLFVRNWPGPDEYSYRVFLMTGRKLRRLGSTSDQLRKLGESGRLMNEVYCIPRPMGFHHSWLGDAMAAQTKIHAYSHKLSDHTSILRTRLGARLRPDVLRRRVENRRPLFDGVELIEDGEIELLSAMSALGDRAREFTAAERWPT